MAKKAGEEELHFLDKTKRDGNNNLRSRTMKNMIKNNFCGSFVGLCLMLKGGLTQARADVERALQINPNYQNAQTLLE